MEDESRFQQKADKALTTLFKTLSSAGDDYGFEVDFNSGVLTITFHKPEGTLAVTPHPATRQICFSDNKQSFRLGWDIVENAFVHDKTGRTVKELLEEAISRRVGDDVSL